MRKDELQFISDSILVEKFAKMEMDIIKSAGLFDSLNLSSIGDFIKNFVKRNVNPDAPGGIAGGVLNLISTGALFRLNPYLGGAAAIANLLGFDLTSVAMKIAEKIKGIISSRGSVTISEVNEIGKEAVGSEAGGMPADDMLYALREAEVKHDLEKRGFLFGGKSKASEPSLRNLFEELYTSGRRGRAKWLIGGLLVWTIKMALLGAGLIAGGTLISKLFGKKPKDPGRLQEGDKPAITVDEAPPGVAVGPSPKVPAPGLGPLQPSGAGTKKFRNDAKNIWYVPVIGNDGVDTLASWTQEIYPKLPIHEDVLLNTPSFMRMVQRLGNPYQGYFAVPEGFTSRKQVVDRFSRDLVRR